MPGVSREQVERAREIDLLSYLQAYEPQELKREGSDRYTTVTHGSLVISKGKWVWNSGSVGGASALDYLVKVRGMGFVEAVETLTGESAAVVPKITPKSQSPPEKPLFVPPTPMRYANAAVSYLQDRGIHPDIIGRCIQEGTLYESRYNGTAVCVFAGKDETGTARFACMRGIGTDLKQDATGSDKRFAFHIPADNTDSKHLAVFEAPIDLLSHATLQQREGWDWDGGRLSLDGISPVALISFLECHPQISRVALCLDNDEAGHAAVKRIQTLLAGDERFAHIHTTVNLPATGKDYNEALLHAIQQEKSTHTQSRSENRAAFTI